MPFDKRKYPPYWKVFSEYIRFERAGNKCEKCGIENGTINERGSKVVLTVAHLDYAGGVCDCRRRTGLKCAKPDHVMALCQKHHLELDKDAHAAVRKKNLARAKDRQRGLLNL